MQKKCKITKVLAILVIMIFNVYVLAGCSFDGFNKNGSKDDNSASSEKNLDEESAEYAKPIKYLVEGLEETNAEKFLKAFPAFISESMDEYITDDYLKIAVDATKEKYGENIKMSFKITDKDKISDENLREMEDEVKESFGNDIVMSKGYKVSVDIVTKGDSSENTEKDTFDVFEIDGNWYVLDLQ